MEDFLFYDEESVDPPISPSTISISDIMADLHESHSSETPLISINPVLATESSPDLTIPPPTTSEVIQHIVTLQSYFECQAISHFPHSSTQDHMLKVFELIA